MIIKAIPLIGIAQAIFFSILVATKENKSRKDSFIIIFLLFVCGELIYRYLHFSIDISDYSWIIILYISFWALFGPITLFYILFTIKEDRKYSKFDLLHFIPIIISIYVVYNYLTVNNYNSFNDYYKNITGFARFSITIWEFSPPAYSIASLMILINHRKNIRNHFSNLKNRYLNWVVVILIGFILYNVVEYTIMFLKYIYPIDIGFNGHAILPIILTIYVFIVGFYGYKQSGIFNDYLLDNTTNSVLLSTLGKPKYDKSGLKTQEKIELTNRLKEIMETNKPYIENDISLKDLADLLSTTNYKLSQVINESFNKNFYNFINSYRIDEVLRLMQKPESEKYTIISLAYDSGFSSKSSFYKSFKQKTGLNPTEYLAKNQITDIPLN